MIVSPWADDLRKIQQGVRIAGALCFWVSCSILIAMRMTSMSFDASGRIRAATLHFAVSVVVALILAILVYGIWYPAPLAQALGISSIFLTLLLVDVTLGPLFTLLVYKKGKPSLKFDLSVIVLLQVAALAYGFWTVAQGRPVWVVFNVDRFDVVQAGILDAQYRERAEPEYQRLSWSGPHWVAALSPEDNEARTQLLFESALGGADLPQRPDLYRPLSEAVAQMKERALPLAKLEETNPSADVKAQLEPWPQARYWVPLMARAQPMVVLLAEDPTDVVAVVPLHPWPAEPATVQ